MSHKSITHWWSKYQYIKDVLLKKYMKDNDTKTIEETILHLLKQSQERYDEMVRLQNCNLKLLRESKELKAKQFGIAECTKAAWYLKQVNKIKELDNQLKEAKEYFELIAGDNEGYGDPDLAVDYLDKYHKDK